MTNLSATETDLFSLYNENPKGFETKFSIFHLGQNVLQTLSLMQKTIDRNLKTMKSENKLPDYTFGWTMEEFNRRHTEENWNIILKLSKYYSADFLDLKRLSSELQNIQACIQFLLDNYILKHDQGNKSKVDKMLHGAALLDNTYDDLRKETAEISKQCEDRKFELDELYLQYRLADVRIRGHEKQLLDKLEVREPCITRYILANNAAKDEDRMYVLNQSESKLRQEIENLNQKTKREIINQFSILDMFNITCSNIKESLISFEKKFSQSYDEHERTYYSLKLKINEILNNREHLNEIKEFYRRRIKEVQENAAQTVPIKTSRY